MYKVGVLVAAVFLGQGCVRGEVQVGKPAPNFNVTDIHHKTHQLADYKGKIVVVENYNLDCPFVVNHYRPGAMQKLQTEAAGQGVVWLVVNSSYADSARLAKEAQSQKIQTATVVHDPAGQIGKTYGFKTTPHLLIIDKSGVLVYNGAIDDQADPDHDPLKARNYVREGLQQLKAGQSPSVAQTKPYGCGAKYAK
jgi:peroxiredoxin